MINALKLVTTQRGHDPREAALVVSGGAGPALAARLGRELQVHTIVVPPHPGIFSAWGMLAAEPRADFRETWFAPLDAETPAELERRFEALERQAVAYFGEGTAAGIRFGHRVEARYKGQEHGVFTGFTPGEAAASFADRFHAAHETAFTFRLPRAAVEVTMLHLEAVLRGPVIALPEVAPTHDPAPPASRGTRDVYLGRERGWHPAPVVDRVALRAGDRLPGPVLVEEPTATTLVLDGQTLSVSPEGLLLIRESAADATC